MTSEPERSLKLSAAPLITLVPQKRRIVNAEQANLVVTQAEEELRKIPSSLEEIQNLARKAGLSIDSDIPSAVKNSSDYFGKVALSAGHSNTDHVVLLSGDQIVDRIAELRRNLLTRLRAEQPESKSDERWDKPRAPGERRRRIIREKDLPSAPPEAPLSGYVIYVGQMTTKIRHDRPNEVHNQVKAVQEISKLWRISLTNDDRSYYNNFSDEARKEYRQQNIEYRATGCYQPSDKFEKIEDSGVWVRKKWEDKNSLEREIATYETVTFPMRPPEYEEDYRRRFMESVERRKAKLKRKPQEAKRNKKPRTKNVRKDGALQTAQV